MRNLKDGIRALGVVAAVLFFFCVPACSGTVGEGGSAGLGGPVDDGGEPTDAGTLPDGGRVPGRDGGTTPHDAGTGPHPDGGTAPPPDGGTVEPLHASGNKLMDPSGNVVQLRGVNRAGTEFMCVSGDAIFDGPSDDASLQAIRTWEANAIRIPLNEDCWLAINGVADAYSGANYQAALGDYVTRAAAQGLYPILELHYTAPGTTLAGGGTGQEPMPDQDHSVALWTSVASYFKNNPEVIFEMFNEPFPDNNQDTDAAWTCWLSGGTCAGINYPVAGMQELVSAVRDAGAGNLVLLGGVTYSNSLSQWNTHVPTDPLNNLAAVWHVYDFNTCNSSSCFDSNISPVIAAHPVVASEIGESDCAGGFITTVMGWLDGTGSSYLAYTWNTDFDCGSGPGLITNYNGTPTQTFGSTYEAHLKSF
jgi:endoglucanase